MYKNVFLKTLAVLFILVMCATQVFAESKWFLTLSSLDGGTEIVNASEYETDGTGEFFVDHKLLAAKLKITSMWDASKEQVTFKGNQKTITLSVSSNEIFIKDNKVYSPIKKVTEVMGYVAKFDAKGNALYLKTPTAAELPSKIINKKSAGPFTVPVTSHDYLKDTSSDWYISKNSNKFTIRGNIEIEPIYKHIIGFSISLDDPSVMDAQFDEVESFLKQAIDTKTVEFAINYAKMKRGTLISIFPKKFITDKYVVKVHSADYSVFIDVFYKTPKSAEIITRFTGKDPRKRYFTFQENTVLKSGPFSIPVTKDVLYNKLTSVENHEVWIEWQVNTLKGLDVLGYYKIQDKFVLCLSSGFILRATPYEVQCKEIGEILKPVLSEKTIQSIMTYANSKVQGKIRTDKLELIDGKYRIVVLDSSEYTLEVLVYYK